MASLGTWPCQTFLLVSWWVGGWVKICCRSNFPGLPARVIVVSLGPTTIAPNISNISVGICHLERYVAILLLFYQEFRV